MLLYGEYIIASNVWLRSSLDLVADLTSIRVFLKNPRYGWNSYCLLHWHTTRLALCYRCHRHLATWLKCLIRGFDINGVRVRIVTTRLKNRMFNVCTFTGGSLCTRVGVNCLCCTLGASGYRVLRFTTPLSNR